MPQFKRKRTPAADPEYSYNSWRRGYNSYQAKNKIRPDEMSDAQNVEVNVDSVDKRLGWDYIGNAKDSRTRGLTVYTHSDGTKQIIRSSGTTLQKYNTSTSDYDNLAGKTYTSDLNTDYIQAYDDLYVFNGTDNLTKYNKDDSPAITVYTAVTAPTSPSAVRAAGLSSGQYTAHFILTHYNEIGETTGTTEFTVAYDKPRSQWNGTTEKLDLSWTNAAGADGTNVYFSDTSGDETFIDTISGSGTTWSFLGGELEPDGLTEPPETNSTAGVIGYKGDFDGTRLWAFKESTLYYSGGGSRDIDHFDSGSGGGALNVAKGDGDEIQHARRTRDGSIIVYKKFSIWKAFFDSAGLINLQLVNPLVGAVGRRAVTTVDDDQVFLSPFGIFTLGNQPNFPTDILRIQSISFPIDKDLERITPSNLPNVVLHYDFKRRLRVAYTQGGASYNNAEFIFKYGAWTSNVGINANCYANFADVTTGSAIVDEQNKLYTIYGTDNEGRVGQLDKGYSDGGSAIDAYFVTKQDDQGQPFRFKKYYDHDIEIGRLQGLMTITQMFNSGDHVTAQIDNRSSGGMGADAVGFDAVGLEIGDVVVGTGGSFHKRWRLFGRQQKYIETKFRENSATGTFSVMSFAGVYRLKSRRQIDSDDILTTT